MTKEARYEFTVEGTHSFPVDMLRYDRCWPKYESTDSVAIADSWFRFPQGARNTLTKITLVGLREPTEGRWASFGWKVLSSKKVI